MTNYQMSQIDKTTTVESSEFDVFSTIILPPKAPQDIFKIIKTERIPCSSESFLKEQTVHLS